MKYALLLYDNEKNADPDEDITPWHEFTDALMKAGVLRGGEALHPTPAATTVRLQGGRVVTTDGPFAETKEQLGGFYLIEVENLDEAIAWAARVPSAASGPVEVRPVWAIG